MNKNFIIYLILFFAAGVFPSLCYYASTIHEIFVVIAMAFFILAVIPTSIICLIIVILFKRKNAIKKYFVTFFVFSLIWWLSFFICLPIVFLEKDFRTQDTLKPYNNIVKELIRYKNIHNEYPQKLENLKISKKEILKDIKYELYDNGKEFMVEYLSDFSRHNIYCSNKNINNYCHTGKIGDVQIYEFRDGWVYYEED